MEQDYPFRPRGRHGFDRDDVINYISQAKLQCQEHLARLEEMESAKAAWYTQAKSLETEKATLVSRNRELEEQLERGGASARETATPGWLTQDPNFAADNQELAALKARCLELEQQLTAEKETTAALQVEKAQWEDRGDIASPFADSGELSALRDQLAQQEAAAQAWMHRVASLEQENAALAQQAHAATESRQAEADARLAAYEDNRAALEARAQALEESLGAEKAALADQLDAFEAEKNGLMEQLAAAEAEKNGYAAKLAALEQEKSGFEAQLPTLEDKLVTLTAAVERTQSDSARRVAELEERATALEQEKAALEAERAAMEQARQAQAQDAATAEEEKKRQSERIIAMEQESYRQAKRIAALEQSEAAALQSQTTLTAEADALRAQVRDLERFSGEKNADVLRSMVLASFNYSNLYVENNLKTAQVITDATSRNIGRVSDSASSLLEQLDTIGRNFNETSDGIRRSLANFQRELDSIQTGMNKRLSQDRFSPLLEENERLRERLETELLAELSTDDETPARATPQPDPAGKPLPFAEELPKDFHDFLDD